MLQFISVSKEVKTMANIKSQIKRIETNEKARARNVAVKAELRTAVKKVRLAVGEGKVEEAQAALIVAISLIHQAVSKGVEHKNTAARQKSHLQGLVNKLKK
jgi:small subunit ribosomal protein S20